MTDFLSPERHNSSGHMHDPYTPSGARSILRRFRDDVIEMLDYMMELRVTYSENGGRAFLSESPLRNKIYVAAAMKTLGLIEESASRNGACVLTLTQKAIDDYERLRRYL